LWTIFVKKSTGTNAQGCNAGYAGREERDRAFQQHIIEQLERYEQWRAESVTYEEYCARRVEEG